MFSRFYWLHVAQVLFLDSKSLGHDIRSGIEILTVTNTGSTSWLKIFLSSVGYKKIAESSKPTAASFSFGKRHTHISRDDTVGPGPAEYDVSGLGSKGNAHWSKT